MTNSTPEVTSTEMLIRNRSTAEIVVAATGLTALMLVTIIGNTTVILAATTYYKLKEQHSNMFIVNLAATDLSVALLVMVFSLVAVSVDMETASGPFVSVLCLIQCAMNYCLIVVSMMTLGFISIDRYVHIIYPLQYADIMTRGRIRILIIWTWIQGLVIGFTPVGLSWIHYDYHEIVCAIRWQSPGAELYVIVAFVTCFVAPGLAMLVCYSVILKEIQRSMSKVDQNTPKLKKISSKSPNVSPLYARQKTTANQHKKIIQSLLVVVIIFFVCMTPFCVTKLVKVLNGNVPDSVNTFATFVQLAASATNPFIYGIFRKEFRNAFKAQYRKIKNKLPCRDHFWDITTRERKTSATLTSYQKKSNGNTAAEFGSKHLSQTSQHVVPTASLKKSLTENQIREVSQLTPDKRSQVTPDQRSLVTPDKGSPVTPDKGLQVTPDKGSPVTPDKGLQVTPDKGLQVTPEKKLQPTDTLNSISQIRNATIKNGRLCEDQKISPACSTPSILPEPMDERLM